MAWTGTAKKLKKYKVVLIKDYVEVISTALEQKADWHFNNNKIIKNSLVIPYEDVKTFSIEDIITYVKK
jgi:hypothetical protein